MVTRALCPRCGNAFHVTSTGNLSQHACGVIPVSKAAGTVEVNKKAPAKKATAKRAAPAKKVAARRGK